MAEADDTMPPDGGDAADTEDPVLLHEALAALHGRRHHPATLDAPPTFELDRRVSLREERWLREERARVVEGAAHAPSGANALAWWIEASAADLDDPLLDHIAQRATLSEMRFFLEQERAAEVPIEEVVSLAARGLGQGPREALAQLHVGWPSVAPLVGELALDTERTLPESLARANLLLSLAYVRRYAIHALGALAAAALSHRSIWARVREGLARLGIEVAHGDDRIDLVVIAALASGDRDRARWMAEGARMRLELDRRALAACREALGQDASHRAVSSGRD